MRLGPHLQRLCICIFCGLGKRRVSLSHGCNECTRGHTILVAQTAYGTLAAAAIAQVLIGCVQRRDHTFKAAPQIRHSKRHKLERTRRTADHRHRHG